MTIQPADIRLILDQGVPRDAAALLRQSGLACKHAGDLGLSRAEDAEILAAARESGAIIVTLDADFHAMIAVSNATGPSVIRLRIQGIDGAVVATLVRGLVQDFADELKRGCLLTVKRRKTTCHLLPLAAME